MRGNGRLSTEAAWEKRLAGVIGTPHAQLKPDTARRTASDATRDVATERIEIASALIDQVARNGDPAALRGTLQLARELTGLPLDTDTQEDN